MQMQGNTLYPQTEAEIMGGVFRCQEHKSKMPNDLEQTVIRQLTAQEIAGSNKLWISFDLSIALKL